MRTIYVVNYDLIKQKRKEKHLSMQNMAMILGLNSRSAYYYKETGKSSFKDWEIAIIVPLLGIKFSDFFKKKGS